MGRWRRSGVVTTAALCLLATLRTGSFVPSPDGASPPISEERRRAAAVRDPTNGRRTFAAAALAAASLVAGAPAHAKEVIQVLPPVPPKPSPDPFIYNLQDSPPTTVAAWKKEPYARMRLYLQAVTQRFIMDMETSAFGGKYFLHWSTDPKSDDFFKFDVVDRNVYNEAAREKKILIDSDLTLAENGIEVYVYKDQQAKEDLTTKVEENRRAPLPCATRSVRATGGLSSEQSGRRKRKGAYDAPFLLPIRESVSRFHSIPGGCEDLVIIPSQLQNAIRVIQSTPFPEFVGGSRRVQQQKITIEDKN
eukprot:g21527.t1